MIPILRFFFSRVLFYGQTKCEQKEEKNGNNNNNNNNCIDF